MWGIGHELSEKEWRSVMRQLLARGIVDAEGEYGVLVPGPEAGPVLRSEETVDLAVDRSPAKSAHRPAAPVRRRVRGVPQPCR